MNKILKLITVTAILSMMAACVRNYGEDPDLGPTDNISMFPVLEEDMTRSIINTMEDLQDEQIGVYGYKNASGAITQVFENKALYYDAIWKYSGTKYWDKKASYWYVAYAPLLSTSGSGLHVSHSQDHTLTICSIPKWQTSDISAKDLMTALSNNTATWYLSNNNGVVDLYFHHILSQLVIRAYTLSENSTFKVTGITIGANQNGKRVPGTDSYDYSVNYTSGQVSYQVDADAYNVNILTNTTDDVPYLEDVEDKATGSLIVSHKLVAPFVSDADGTLKIPITVSYEQDDIAQTPVTVSLGISEMLQGNTYLLYLEFKDNGNKITAFDIKTIPWTDANLSDGKFHNW